MRLVTLARAVGIALASVILVVAGAYVIIDLARWEWNRAVVSALIFLSSLLVVVAMILFRQMHRLEERMGALERQGRTIDVVSTLSSTNRDALARRFRWLERPPDGLGVFVPVLLGAGALLSFLAYAIERLAGAFASSTLDRHTAGQLATDLPLGDGVVGLDGNDDVTAERLGPARRHRVARAAVLMTTLVLAVIAVRVLRDLTQSRPDEVTRPGSTVLVVEIGQRRTIRPMSDVAEDLWNSCRHRLPAPIDLVALTPTSGDRVEMTIDRALGRTGKARLIGCLEDYTLDLVLADVLSVRTSSTLDMLAYVQRTTVKLPDELDARLRHEAARRGMTISEVTREAIEAHLGGPTPRRALLAAGAGASGHDDISARVEEILASEVGSSH